MGHLNSINISYVTYGISLLFSKRQTGRAEEDLIQQGNIPIVIAPGIRGHTKVVWYFNNATGRIISPRIDIRTDGYNGFYVVAESIFELIEKASHMISQTASRINQGIFPNCTLNMAQNLWAKWKKSLKYFKVKNWQMYVAS